MPHIDLKTALEMVQTEFGLSGNLSRLPGYADDNFHLRGEQGEYVIKFASSDTRLNELMMQNAALGHLRQSNPNLILPRAQSTRGGRSLIQVALAMGTGELKQTRWLRVLSYVPGSPYAKIKQRNEALHLSIGNLLGELDSGLSGFHHPAAQREMDWNLLNLHRLVDDVRFIADKVLRGKVAYAVQEFTQQVLPQLDGLPKQIIHNDANDYNVIISQNTDTHYQPSLIDFGDLAYSIRAAELAIALAYLMLDQDEPIAVAQAIIQGYTRCLPLKKNELKLIYYLINGRLCNSLIMSSKLQIHRPDDEYLMISAQPARRLLSFMQDMGHEAFNETLRLV